MLPLSTNFSLMIETMKINVLLSLCLFVLLSSCDDAVVVTEQLPFESGKPFKTLPSEISGTYVNNACNDELSLLYEKVDAVRISQKKSLLNISLIDDLDKISCVLKYDLSTDKVYLGECFISNMEFIDGQDAKVFQQDEKIYLNIQDFYSDGWLFVIIELINVDRIKITISTYNTQQYEKEKYDYGKNKSLLVRERKGMNDLVFNVEENYDEFEKILNDDKLLHSCIFEKQE